MKATAQNCLEDMLIRLSWQLFQISAGVRQGQGNSSGGHAHLVHSLIIAPLHSSTCADLCKLSILADVCFACSSSSSSSSGSSNADNELQYMSCCCEQCNNTTGSMSDKLIGCASSLGFRVSIVRRS